MKATRIVLAFFLAAAIGGCTTQVERDFTIADVRVIGLYIQQAQPAVAAYCEALCRAGMADKADQLRADTTALAAEARANAALRLDKLRADRQLVESARQAVNVAGVVLDAIEANRASREEVENGEIGDRPADN